VSAGDYTSLSIEIQYAPGMQPQDQSVSNLVSFLSSLLNKPGGISVSTKQVTTMGKTSVSVADITAFADANRSLYTDGQILALYIYFADAAYEQQGVIGLAFRNTSLVVLEKTVQDNSRGLNQASRVKVESGVLMHEAGHLLGLVNNGTAMVTAHEDAANRAHCNNRNCLMYYAVETSGLLNMFDNTVPSLEANCQADLKANGGK